MVSDMSSSTFMSQRMMGYTFGGQHHDQNSKWDPLPIVYSNKQDLLMTDDRPKFGAIYFMHTLILTRLLVPKHIVHLVVLAYDWLAAQLRTNVSSNLPLWGHPLKQNSWRRTIWEK